MAVARSIPAADDATPASVSVHPGLVERIRANNAKLAAIEAELPPDVERYADDELVGDDESVGAEMVSADVSPAPREKRPASGRSPGAHKSDTPIAATSFAQPRTNQREGSPPKRGSEPAAPPAPGRVEQLEARLAHNQEAARSNRAPATDHGGDHGASRESGKPSGEIGGAQRSNVIRVRAETAPAHVGSTTARGTDEGGDSAQRDRPAALGRSHLTSQKRGTSGKDGMPKRSAPPVDPCEGVAAAMPRVRSASGAAALGGSVSSLVQVMSVDRFVGEHMPKNTGIVERIRECLPDGSRLDLVELQQRTGLPPDKLRAALDYQRREKRMAFDDEGRWYVIGDKPPRGAAAKKEKSLARMVRDKLTPAPKPLSAGLVAGFPPAPRVAVSTAFVNDLLSVRARVIDAAVRKVQKLDELIASHAE